MKIHTDLQHAQHAVNSKKWHIASCVDALLGCYKDTPFSDLTYWIFTSVNGQISAVAKAHIQQ